MQNRYYPAGAVLVLISIMVSAVIALADEVPRMSVDVLESRLAKGDVAVLDVRSDWDWNNADTRIPGASRVNPNEIGQWAKNLPEGKTIVLYCT